MDEELERFKRIKLHEYAASLGYEVDRKESSKREIILRRQSDKIAVRLDADSHYVYYSFRDETDNGTIIDFIQGRQERNFGRIRQKLRAFSPSPVKIYDQLDISKGFDRAFVQERWQTAKDLIWHRYLEEERRLPLKVLKGPRFEGRIRIDAKANPLFLHTDDEGACGYEIRNRHFKGFAALGRKSLFGSNDFPADRVLVFSENAIDGISYETIWKPRIARYRSFAGGLSEFQVGEIRKACQTMPEGSEIVCITHPDPEGDRYADVIRECSPLPFRVHRPENVKDWNDFLRSASFPAARFEASLD